jgi:hypothetical protein
MAVYESRFKELGFYVDGKLHKFKNGRFTTEDKAVMAVLDKLTDVKRVDEPKAEPKQTKPAEEPKASEVNESKPKAKKPSAK